MLRPLTNRPSPPQWEEGRFCVRLLACGWRAGVVHRRGSSGQIKKIAAIRPSVPMMARPAASFRGEMMQQDGSMMEKARRRDGRVGWMGPLWRRAYPACRAVRRLWAALAVVDIPAYRAGHIAAPANEHFLAKRLHKNARLRVRFGDAAEKCLFEGRTLNSRKSFVYHSRRQRLSNVRKARCRRWLK